MSKFYSEKGVVMMLKRYVTDVFDPNADEIFPMGEAALAAVMKRTYFMRSLVRARTCLTANFRSVAAIAMLLGFSCFFIARQNSSTDHQAVDAQPQTSFRGVTDGTVATASGTSEKEESPLAYLVDVSGDIAIVKGGKKYAVKSSCEVLNTGDELDIPDGAKGKVMYEDAFYEVSGPVRYRIASPDPLKINVAGAGNPIEPKFSTRGAHLGLGKGESFVVAPTMMLAQVIPPTTRAGDAEVVVYSPRGACYNECLTVGITGDPRVEYSILALDMEGAEIGGAIKVCGSSCASANALFAASLVEDDIYSIKVTRDGKTVNEVSTSTFWLVSGDERKKIARELQPVSSIASETAKDFFTANVLYANGCNSEAYFLSKKLCEREPKNALYVNLMRLCAKALKLRF